MLLLCNNYFYAGKLTGVNEKDVLIEDASIVYETGPWDSPEYKDVQALGRNLYVRIDSIESYCRGK